MTLIITAAAAIVATVLRFVLPSDTARKFHLGFMSLMYWGASLMWAVDGFFVMSEGEPFVELSDSAVMADDAILGVCVVVLGIIVWGIVNLVKKNSVSKANSVA